MNFLLALDQGTTSSRAMLVDTEGRVLGVASREFPQHYPRPGWVEHDPEDLVAGQMDAAAQVLGDAGADPSALLAIGITNQRETTLLWRRDTGEPVSRAIVWQDRRTSARCEALRQLDAADSIRRRTGLVPDPYFSATKLEWLLREIPDARAAAERGDLAFGTVDSWLLWNLTGGQVHATDPTNASRTLLWNLAEERWDPEMLALFRIPEQVLPEVRPSACGFAASTTLGPPVTGIAGDQQAALFGQAGWEAGVAKNTYGTGCFLLLPTGSTAPDPPPGLLATRACGLDVRPLYALEGSVFVAGAVVQWLRDGLGILRDAAESETLARSIPDSGGVWLVPAFTGLGAPWWDPSARGTMLGVTRGTGRAHLARAALESIAHQTCDVVETMTASGNRLERVRVDGGASANDWLMQLQADLLGIPVERAAVRETTAYGAALLAGLGAGLWGASELRTLWRADRVFDPSWTADRREAARAGWRRAVERSRNWAVEETSG